MTVWKSPPPDLPHKPGPREVELLDYIDAYVPPQHRAGMRKALEGYGRERAAQGFILGADQYRANR